MLTTRARVFETKIHRTGALLLGDIWAMNNCEAAVLDRAGCAQCFFHLIKEN